MALSFDFGSNWQAYSRARLEPERVREAEESLRALLGRERIEGKTFLDIGCGSGLFSIAAASCGARRVLGFDVNPVSVSTSVENAQRYLPAGVTQPEFRLGSILDDELVQSLEKFDTVYAWGSLHHTGEMWRAIRNAASLVAPGGSFALAIYDDHWSVPFWKQVKKVYNVTPRPLRKVWDVSFGAAMYAAVWAVARENPMRKDRGMDFWYDVVDWLGGYPYEVATPQQLRDFLAPLGFRFVSCASPRVPTGCNEIVFQRDGVA